MRIGKHEIGPGHPTFCIAELGINHNGDLMTALGMVYAAKRAGADAIKVQAFSPDHFCTEQAMYKGERQLDMFARYYLSDTSIRAIAEECHKLDIIFFGTPECLDHAKLLLDCGAPCIKIGSDDLLTVPFLEQIARLEAPTILSSGMGTESDVMRAANIFHRDRDSGGHPDIAILVCTSLYPTPPEKAELWRIRQYMQRFSPLPIGYSDHSEDNRSGMLAVAAGACIVERHFTVDKYDYGPDQRFSADPEDFENMVDGIRTAEEMFHYGNRRQVLQDQDMQPIAHRSIVAAGDIRAGDLIYPWSITWKRPGTGMSPIYYRDLIGKVAKRDIMEDEQLTMDDVT